MSNTPDDKPVFPAVSVSSPQSAAPVDHRVVAELAKLTPEQLQGEIAALDKLHRDSSAHKAVLASMGAAPIDNSIAQDHQAHGVNQAPRPGNYAQANLGEMARDGTPESVAAYRQGMGEWASQLQMSKEMGTAVIERIASLTHQLEGMDAGERTRWGMRQVEQLGAQFTRDPELATSKELPKLKKEAAEALDMRPEEVSVSQAYGVQELKALKDAAAEVLKRAPGGLSDKLTKAAQFNDVWLLKNLIIHGAQLNEMARRYPPKK